MMKVRVAEVGTALHPSEVIVAVNTTSGLERLVVDRRTIDTDATIRVGYPIRTDSTSMLIELPRESFSGSWRVWVSTSEIVDEPERLTA